MPNEQLYFDTMLDEYTKERWDALKCWNDTERFYTADSNHELFLEHSAKFSKFQQQLQILTEQEKPQDTEQEEKQIRYWEEKVLQHSNDTSRQYLNVQLKQVDDKRAAREALYEREKQRIEEQWQVAQQEFARVRCSIEQKIEAHDANHMKAETYFVGNLVRAKKTLEGKRSIKSKPRIKLEMEFEPHKVWMEKYREELNRRGEWEDLQRSVVPYMKDWISKEQKKWLAECDRIDRAVAAAAVPAAVAPKPKPAPLKAVVVRKKKEVDSGKPITNASTQLSCAYQYTVSQTDGNGVHTTTSTSFAIIPWSPMSCLA
jgi:hypothetical protein